MKGETDWDWCKRQVRFNKRAGAFPYNQNAESRKGVGEEAKDAESTKPSPVELVGLGPRSLAMGLRQRCRTDAEVS